MSVRTRRRVWQTLWVTTLVGCAVVVALGLHSVWWVAGGNVLTSRYGLYCFSERGVLSLTCSVAYAAETDRLVELNADSYLIPDAFWERQLQFRRRAEHRRVSFLGVALQTGHPDKRYANGRWIPVRVELPHWLVLFIGLFVSRFFRGRMLGALRAERRAAGLCPDCGYDTRATPDRCPECGAMRTLLLSLFARLPRPRHPHLAPDP
ncbi:MAG TPA: hypothetical protein VFB66_06915 [Tepidisphaeraceae bacterium]|nr:hypothetical protein [Tepidisphaeraceae bacterium]